MFLYRNYKSLVIYKDHAYDFGEVRHAYKDSIYVEQLLSGCAFMEAVERLEVWKAEQASKETGLLNMFDSLTVDRGEADTYNEGFLFIPDDISNV